MRLQQLKRICAKVIALFENVPETYIKNVTHVSVCYDGGSV